MSTPPASATAQAIEARGLSKSFGDREALREVSFAAAAGELLAVIGPNGAGKTTLLSILAGIREPDAGEVHLPRGEVGWVPQQAALYRRLTVAENLRLFARLEEVDDVDASGRADARADRPSPTAAAIRSGRSRAATSSGSTSRSGCSPSPRSCSSTSPRPASTRASARASGSSCSASPARGTTVIFSTHNIAEAERYGDRAARASPTARASSTAPSPSSTLPLRRPTPRPAAPTSSPPSSASWPSTGTRQGDPELALAAAQGSPDHAPLAAGHGAARRLSDRDRRPDRLRAQRRAREAPGRLPQRGPARHPAADRRRGLRPARRQERALRADRVRARLQRGGGAREGRVRRRARGADPAGGPDRPAAVARRR